MSGGPQDGRAHDPRPLVLEKRLQGIALARGFGAGHRALAPVFRSRFRFRFATAHRYVPRAARPGPEPSRRLEEAQESCRG